MKIAFLNKYQDRVTRGAETFVAELSKRLSRHHKVDVISYVHYFDLYKGKYDVIIPTNGRFQVFLVRIICSLTGAKMIVSGQSGMGWDDRLNLCSSPDFFIALSSRALAWARKVCPRVKSLYIPNGVDLSRFRAKDGSGKGKIKTVLAVGAFTEQKRLDLVIAAVSKLDNTKLIIAGGGGDLKDEIANQGMSILGSDRFKILSVPFENMPGVYERAHVFTLPSRPSESFGNVLVEAMATNLPIVATNDPIRREIVGDAGIFVDPTDTDAYANALKKALDTNWGDKPRKQAEKFSWDKIAEEYENLIESLSDKS